MTKKILYVTDFSAGSLKVAAPVAYLARKLKARLELCHVDEEERVLPGGSSTVLVEFLNRVEARRSQSLEGTANSLREQELDVDIVRLKGYASKEIIRYAQEQSVALVAISALGTEGFKSLLMGSTAANVLRNCHRPVLFLGANVPLFREYSISSVLYPTDFSPVSRDGLWMAARLSMSLGAKLNVLHVMRIPSFIPGLPGEPPLAFPVSGVENLNEEFQRMMDELVEDTGIRDVSWEVTIAQDESVAIVETGMARKADLIVIPKVGEGVLEGLFFGRTAENVARLSSVPTLLFHPAEVAR